MQKQIPAEQQQDSKQFYQKPELQDLGTVEQLTEQVPCQGGSNMKLVYKPVRAG
jgi:hypothetical protein